jgi:hypothetical protein
MNGPTHQENELANMQYEIAKGDFEYFMRLLDFE